MARLLNPAAKLVAVECGLRLGQSDDTPQELTLSLSPSVPVYLCVCVCVWLNLNTYLSVICIYAYKRTLV